MSIYLVSVGWTSFEDNTKILETVTGSNHRLIQLQTVGKKDGAPMIWVSNRQLQDIGISVE